MILTALAATILLFGVVLLRGAPYLPTMRARVEDSLDLLALKPGQTLLELGSGDGAVLVAAAQRGINAVGYELNPLLVIISKIRCWRYRQQIQIIWGDYWVKEWPPSDGMFVFLLDKYMEKLDKKVMQYVLGKPYRVVSNTFKIPNKKATRARNGLFLYLYK